MARCRWSYANSMSFAFCETHSDYHKTFLTPPTICQTGLAAITPTHRLLILAGDFSQAQYWAREWGLAPRFWLYASEARLLEGMRDFEYVIVGTFWYRRDAREIEQMLQVIDAKGAR